MQAAPALVTSSRPYQGRAGAVGIGLAVLAVGMLAVRNGTVSGVEESTFHAVNDLPGWLYPAVWPFVQLGALAIGPVVAIVATACRRYRLAIAAVLATVLKLVTERAVKAIVSRQRPGTSIGGEVELRGDVSPSGESFVSGHAVLIAALAGVVTPYLPGRWKIMPWVLVGAVMLGRVYVGAHNPLDVVCGAALGVAIAGALNLVLRVGRRHGAERTPS
jgi:membrane-associated phospholipid phosphatase